MRLCYSKNPQTLPMWNCSVRAKGWFVPWQGDADVLIYSWHQLLARCWSGWPGKHCFPCVFSNLSRKALGCVLQTSKGYVAGGVGWQLWWRAVVATVRCSCFPGELPPPAACSELCSWPGLPSESFSASQCFPSRHLFCLMVWELYTACQTPPN